MSIASSLDRLDVPTAITLATGETEIVVVTPEDQLVGTYRLMRYSGIMRGKGFATFAVKDANDKFFLKSDRELGLSDKSPYVAFLKNEVNVDDIIVDLTDTAIKA